MGSAPGSGFLSTGREKLTAWAAADMEVDRGRIGPRASAYSEDVGDVDSLAKGSLGGSGGGSEESKGGKFCWPMTISWAMFSMMVTGSEMGCSQCWLSRLQRRPKSGESNGRFRWNRNRCDSLLK
jgi:hypothetical protein